MAKDDLTKKVRINTELKVAHYIDLYCTMQEGARSIRSLSNIYPKHPGLKPEIEELGRYLRQCIGEFKEIVPYGIRERLKSGQTPDQIESLVTNILLELKD